MYQFDILHIIILIYLLQSWNIHTHIYNILLIIDRILYIIYQVIIRIIVLSIMLSGLIIISPFVVTFFLIIGIHIAADWFVSRFKSFVGRFRSLLKKVLRVKDEDGGEENIIDDDADSQEDISSLDTTSISTTPTTATPTSTPGESNINLLEDQKSEFVIPRIIITPPEETRILEYEVIITDGEPDLTKFRQAEKLKRQSLVESTSSSTSSTSTTSKIPLSAADLDTTKFDLMFDEFVKPQKQQHRQPDLTTTTAIARTTTATVIAIKGDKTLRRFPRIHHPYDEAHERYKERWMAQAEKDRMYARIYG